MSIETINQKLDALEALEKAATPGPILMRYAHGGGRAYIQEGENRKLVADYYHEEDREFYTAARNALPCVIAALRVAVDALLFARAETQTVGQEYGFPHVADNSDSALAEIERRLAGEAQ